MRSNPTDYQLVAPASLQAAVSLLAAEPGGWLPIAGGTDVMVQYAAGKLPARRLVSIWNLPELRRIETLPDEIRIGAGCTYTDLREHASVQREFSLLARAAAWTGGIANQNRGTIGGNIVNASPAADSLPALLVYEAELILVSVRGERRVPYKNFHTGYKKTTLASDELIRTICLARRFSEHLAHARKVGARNAQAISKVCISALGRCAAGLVDDVRIAVGSVAPVPIRLTETERLVTGKAIEPAAAPSAGESTFPCLTLSPPGTGGRGLPPAVPGYRQEKGVNPESSTETYVAARLLIDNWRWADVPFYLRTGKRLPRQVSEIAIHFRRAPHMVFRGQGVAGNSLVLNIQPDEGISICFQAKLPGQEMRLRAVPMNFSYHAAFGGEERSAYATLIADCMRGDATLFDRADGVEAAWALVDPILAAWREVMPKFPNYAGGEWGPREADELLERDGRHWRKP